MQIVTVTKVFFQPDREDLLNTIQSRIYDFEKMLTHARGYDFTFQAQRKIAFLWTLAELELQGIPGTISAVAEVTGTSPVITGRTLKTLFDMGMLNRSTGKHMTAVYTLREEYLREMYQLQKR